MEASTKPEARARTDIDTALELGGWMVQDRDAVNLPASRGVTVREFPLKYGEANYLTGGTRRARRAGDRWPGNNRQAAIRRTARRPDKGLPGGSRIKEPGARKSRASHTRGDG